MEMEELTKSQIVLLVLLVSFVTSIATGIVTVSLLAQAPPAITQTVNRIVERTVETVVPAENQQASVITKETTVVVKEDDLITESIGKSFNKTVRIHEGVSTTSPVIALGAVVAPGVVVTDLSVVKTDHAVSIQGVGYSYKVSKTFPDVGIAVLSAEDKTKTPNVTSFKKGDTAQLKLGQTLIGLYGTKNDRVSMTTLAARNNVATIKVDEKTEVKVQIIETTIAGVITPGSPLINIFGDLVGISTSVSRVDARGSFISFSDIASLITVDTEAKPEEGATSAQ